MMVMWISLVHPHKISGSDGWWCNERPRTAATSFDCGLFGAVARCRKQEGGCQVWILFFGFYFDPNTSLVVRCPPLTESSSLPKVNFLSSPTFEINYVSKVCWISFLLEIHESWISTPPKKLTQFISIPFVANCTLQFAFFRSAHLPVTVVTLSLPKCFLLEPVLSQRNAVCQSYIKKSNVSRQRLSVPLVFMGLFHSWGILPGICV